MPERGVSLDEGSEVQGVEKGRGGSSLIGTAPSVND